MSLIVCNIQVHTHYHKTLNPDAPSPAKKINLVSSNVAESYGTQDFSFPRSWQIVQFRCCHTEVFGRESFFAHNVFELAEQEFLILLQSAIYHQICVQMWDIQWLLSYKYPTKQVNNHSISYIPVPI